MDFNLVKQLFNKLHDILFIRENVFARNVRQLIEEKIMYLHLKLNFDWIIIRNEVFDDLSIHTGISTTDIKSIIDGKIIPQYPERFLLSQYFNLPERLIRTYKFYDNTYAPAFNMLRDKSKAH